jgi:hypothetical protein
MSELLTHAQVWERIRQHPPAAWWMLDLVDLEQYIMDYASYTRRVARGPQDGCGCLSVGDYYPTWLQAVQDAEEPNRKPYIDTDNPGPLCPKCGTPIAIRNPTGKCDHLYMDRNGKVVP